MVERIKMKLRMREGLGPGHIVLNVDPAPLSQRGTAFQFSAHVRCGQTAAWIKIPLGMEMGLGPGHIVLDGYPAPPPLKGHSPQFSANVPYGQTAGWTKMPLGMEVGAQATLFSMGTQSPRRKKAQPPLNFWPMSIVAKRLDG